MPVNCPAWQHLCASISSIIKSCTTQLRATSSTVEEKLTRASHSARTASRDSDIHMAAKEFQRFSNLSLSGDRSLCVCCSCHARRSQAWISETRSPTAATQDSSLRFHILTCDRNVNVRRCSGSNAQLNLVLVLRTDRSGLRTSRGVP